MPRGVLRRRSFDRGIMASGFRIRGVGCRVQDRGFRVCALGFARSRQRLEGLGFRAQDSTVLNP